MLTEYLYVSFLLNSLIPIRFLGLKSRGYKMIRSDGTDFHFTITI